MKEAISVRVDGGVGIITIDRPETLNALDVPTLQLLDAHVGDLERNADVRVLIFTGAGDRAFVAGGDIADLDSRRGLEHYLGFADVVHRVFRHVETVDKPTISAINGWALGGGMELLLATDLRIAAATAKLGLPEITLGLFPGAGGTQRLLRQVAPCKARELMFIGDAIAAEEALTIGLINKVVPTASLMQEALMWARRIADKSPLVLKLLKRTLSSGGDMPLAAALAHEQAMIGLVLDSEDAHEGCGAFLAKRKAVFSGR